MKLGKKLKSLRFQCDLTQEELADRCELTKGYISQLENDLTSPSIATLVDILSALGTNLNEFFSGESERQIVFKKSDYTVKEGDVSIKWLISDAQRNAMEPVVIEMLPFSKTEDVVPYDGEEFGFVLSGEVVINLGKKKYVCHSGESFYVHCDAAHSIENKKNQMAKVLWVSTPPNF